VPLTTTVIVSSEEAWVSTGVDVTAGDRLTITAAGTIRFSSAGDTATPNGSGRGDALAGSSGCVYLVCGAGIPVQSLVGRIGSPALTDVTGFLVGGSYNNSARTSGRLYVGFNDGFVRPDRTGLDSGGVLDNSGSFTVNISITRAAALSGRARN
jgi:hypothetical protein